MQIGRRHPDASWNNVHGLQLEAPFSGSVHVAEIGCSQFFASFAQSAH
jgi:hypothetical protein